MAERAGNSAKRARVDDGATMPQGHQDSQWLTVLRQCCQPRAAGQAARAGIESLFGADGFVERNRVELWAVAADAARAAVEAVALAEEAVLSAELVVRLLLRADEASPAVPPVSEICVRIALGLLGPPRALSDLARNMAGEDTTGSEQLSRTLRLLGALSAGFGERAPPEVSHAVRRIYTPAAGAGSGYGGGNIAMWGFFALPDPQGCDVLKFWIACPAAGAAKPDSAVELACKVLAQHPSASKQLKELSQTLIRNAQDTTALRSQTAVVMQSELLKCLNSDAAPRPSAGMLLQLLPREKLDGMGQLGKTLAAGTAQLVLMQLLRMKMFGLVPVFVRIMCRGLLKAGRVQQLMSAIDDDRTDLSGTLESLARNAGDLPKQRESTAELFDLVEFLLLGYQHSAQLIVKLQPTLVRVWKKLAADPEQGAKFARFHEMLVCLLHQHAASLRDVPAEAAQSVYPHSPKTQLIRAALEESLDERALQSLLIDDADVRARLARCSWVHDGCPVASVLSDGNDCGLVNMGNTCFINCWIQALAATHDWRSWLLGVNLLYPESGAGGRAGAAAASRAAAGSSSGDALAWKPAEIARRAPVAWQLQRLMARLELGLRTAARPEALLKALPQWCRGGGQQDTFELALAVFDLLERELKPTAWHASVHNAFGGQLANQVRCLKCDNVSRTLEPYQHLVLMIPQKHKEIAATIPAMISRLLKVEKLEGDSQYRCDECDCYCDAEKSVRLVDSPRHLILMLNRFEWNDPGNGKPPAQVKVCTRVGMPLWAWTPMEQGERDVLYELYAVVVHSGTTANSGHYYSFARRLQPDPGAAQNCCHTAVGHVIWRWLSELPMESSEVPTSALGKRGPGRESALQVSLEKGIGRVQAVLAAWAPEAELQHVLPGSNTSYASAHAVVSGLCTNAFETLEVTTWAGLTAGLHTLLNLIGSSATAHHDSWREYNDSVVRPASFDTIEKVGSASESQTAYVLLYRRSADAHSAPVQMRTVSADLRLDVAIDHIELLKSRAHRPLALPAAAASGAAQRPPGPPRGGPPRGGSGLIEVIRDDFGQTGGRGF